jgi:bifunctional ADP-heptose synthase (sugar kinase/adenylyltransferase)
VLFDENTAAETIAAVKPDLLVKRADYTVEEVVGADTVRAVNGRVKLVPLVRSQSTTALIRRAAEIQEP